MEKQDKIKFSLSFVREGHKIILVFKVDEEDIDEKFVVWNWRNVGEVMSFLVFDYGLHFEIAVKIWNELKKSLLGLPEDEEFMSEEAKEEKKKFDKENKECASSEEEETVNAEDSKDGYSELGLVLSKSDKRTLQ